MCVYIHAHVCKHSPAAPGPLSLSAGSAVAGPKIPAHVAPDNGRPSAGPAWCPPGEGVFLFVAEFVLGVSLAAPPNIPPRKGGFRFRV